MKKQAEMGSPMPSTKKPFGFSSRNISGISSGMASTSATSPWLGSKCGTLFFIVAIKLKKEINKIT